MIFKANIKFMNSETNRIEYKQELTDDLEKEAVAFLNYPEGGVLYIGIEKTGTAIGVIDIDSDMLKIKDRLKNNMPRILNIICMFNPFFVSLCQQDTGTGCFYT